MLSAAQRLARGVQLANGAGGLCATPIKSIAQAVCCPSSVQAMPIPGKVAGRSVAEVLHDLYRPQELRRALAIATLNAAVETLWLRDGPPQGVQAREGKAFDQVSTARWKICLHPCAPAPRWP